jgi:hypothetical protein
MARVFPRFSILGALAWVVAIAGFVPGFVAVGICCVVFFLLWRAARTRYARLWLIAACASGIGALTAGGIIRVLMTAVSAGTLVSGGSVRRDAELGSGTFSGALVALALVSFSGAFVGRTDPAIGALAWVVFGWAVGAGSGSWSALTPQSTTRIGALIAGLMAGQGFFLISFIPLPLVLASCAAWLWGTYLWFVIQQLSRNNLAPSVLLRLVMVPAVVAGTMTILCAMR